MVFGAKFAARFYFNPMVGIRENREGMKPFFTTFLHLLSRFTGSGGGLDHGVVQFGLGAVLWGVLVVLARQRQRRTQATRERLLLWGFALAMSRDLLLLAMAFLQMLGALDPVVLQQVLPPLENALLNIAMVTVAGAFIRYLLDDARLTRRYLHLGLDSVLLCYLATFWWWGTYVPLHPGVRFSQTWCDWLFRLDGSLLLAVAPVLLARRIRGWRRNLVVSALGLFFLYEALKMSDMALGEVYEPLFASIRHGLYLLGIVLLGWLYLREQEAERSAAEAALRQQSHFLDTILNAIPAPIFFKDAHGAYLGCNEAFCKYLGQPRERIVGRTVYGVAPTEQAQVYHEADLALMRQGGNQVYEGQVVAADGSPHEVIFHKSVFPDADGGPGGLVGTMLDISERKRAEEHIRQLAYFDPLTGLPNRSLLQSRLEQALQHPLREGGTVALLFLDLDRFKEINDTFGHAGGDRLLQGVAERLRGLQREGDTLARFGGDEFALLLDPVRGELGAAGVAEKIIELFAHPFELEEQEIFTSTSIGIVLAPRDGGDMGALLKHADMAMYAAKERGRNVFQFFSQEMNRRALEHHQVATSLRRALQQEEFFLVYQPQFDLSGGRICGVEALLRWRHPEQGLVSPAAFIPVAEETGLIREIGEWALRTACAQNQRWQEAGLPAVLMGVNLSARQFRQQDLIGRVERVLAETGLEPRYLELELTESMLMEAADATIGILSRLRMRGIRLAIDDFGTGYSSLSYLKHFPIDRIKIDRSFVRDISRDGDDTAIVEAIIAMARSLRLGVIAEGVETEEQRRFLLERGCQQMQGFLFARPLSAEECGRLLAGERPAAPDQVPPGCSLASAPAESALPIPARGAAASSGTRRATPHGAS